MEQTAGELSSRSKTHAGAVDVTDLPTVEQAVRETEKALAPIDILVANAGIARRAGVGSTTGPSIRISRSDDGRVRWLSSGT